MEGRIAIGGDRALLDHVARPDVALAIWWRRMPEALRLALGGLDLTGVDDMAVEVDLNGSVDAALTAAGYEGAVQRLLCADIDLLIRRHAALTGEDRQRVRLEVIASEPVSRFRADRTTFGLRCTYVGPGIQWCRIDGPDAIYEVPAGAVGVFKGRALLDQPVILHRSPSVEASRLVLAIDPAHDETSDRSRRIVPAADPC